MVDDNTYDTTEGPVEPSGDVPGENLGADAPMTPPAEPMGSTSDVPEVGGPADSMGEEGLPSEPLPPVPPAPPAQPAPPAPPSAPEPTYPPPPAPPSGGYAPPPPPPGAGYGGAPSSAGFGGPDKQKVVAGILAILLGSLGIHKFYLGYQREGIILLVTTIAGILLSCIGIGFIFVWVPQVIGIVEGIIYLTKSDEEFYQMYVAGRKAWF